LKQDHPETLRNLSRHLRVILVYVTNILNEAFVQKEISIMNLEFKSSWKHRLLLVVGSILLWLFLSARTALAAPALHEAPKGSEWIMADWMFLSFAIFAGVAFLAFLFVLKSGLLSNLEDAKYHVLEIDEEDYYTPDWAREGGDA